MAETLIMELFYCEEQNKRTLHWEALDFSLPGLTMDSFSWAAVIACGLQFATLQKSTGALRGLCFAMLFREWALNCQPRVCQMRSENTALKTVL